MDPRSGRRGAVWAAILCALALQVACGGGDPAPPDRWADDLARFAAEDRAAPPAAGGVVFIGSSSVASWNVGEAFPGLPVINRGLGGSRALDLVRRLDRLVAPYRPARVVTYVGDNDVASGRAPEQALDDVLALLDALGESAPGADVVMLAIKPSPARLEHLDAMQRTNSLIREAVASRSDVTWVDVHTPMLDGAGAPRPELYDDDGLHLSPAGYAVWQATLAPILLENSP